MGQVDDIMWQWLTTTDGAALAFVATVSTIVLGFVVLGLWAKARDKQIVETLEVPSTPALEAPVGTAHIPARRHRLGPAPMSSPPADAKAPDAKTVGPELAPPVPPPSADGQARPALVIEPLGIDAGGMEAATFASALTGHLALVLARLAPHLEVARELVAGARLSEAPLTGSGAHYRLGGRLSRAADGLTVQFRLIDRRSGAQLFDLECEAKPENEERILAEVAQQVLRHAA